MNVVEAIDAWIDDRIDDLSDAELEEILDLVDLLADTEFAGIDADFIDDDDIDDMVALIDGDDEQITYAQWVLSNALMGEEDLGAGYLDVPADTSYTDHAGPYDACHHEIDTPRIIGIAGDLGAGADDVDADESVDAEAEADVAADEYVDDIGDDEAVFARFDREIRGAAGAAAEPADEPDETDKPDESDETDRLGNGRGRMPDPIVLVPAADGLGPSFLPPIDLAPRAPVRNDSWKRWTVASLILAGLAVFAYGTVQLIGSLDETSVATSTTTSQGADGDAPSPLTSTAADTTSVGAAAASAASTDAGTPEAEPRPPTQTALVLSDGSIVLATASSPESEAPTEFATVYEPNAAENLGAALRASWSDDELGVVDSTGNVHFIDPSANALSTIYVADDDLAPAIAIAAAGPQVAILTDDGSIWLMKKTDAASARTLTELWDAGEEEAQVTSITATADQLAFTLDTGDAKLMDIATSRNTITDLWSSTDDTPAPRIENGPNNTLLWIWEGAISRYRLDAGDDTRVEVVWDPATVDEKPAIRFSPFGEQFAVILQDGGVVLATEGGAAQKLWDPAETELRAQAISASADEIIMLLETGSVLRMLLDADPPRLGAIWDVTDDTLSPVRQVAIRP